MSKRDAALDKLLSGKSDANFRYDELVTILEQQGLQNRQRDGSHNIFSYPPIIGQLNLQRAKNGKAKVYQVKQARKLLQAILGYKKAMATQAQLP